MWTKGETCARSPKFELVRIAPTSENRNWKTTTAATKQMRNKNKTIFASHTHGKSQFHNDKQCSRDEASKQKEEEERTNVIDMRIIDHGFMNKIPMFEMYDATKRICLLTVQNSLRSITSSLTRSLARSPTCLLIHSAPSFFSLRSLSLAHGWAVVSLHSTHSRACDTYMLSLLPILFLWATASKKSFGWFYSLALKSTDVLVNQPKQTHAAYSPVHDETKRKKDNVVIDFSDKFFYRLTRWPMRIPIFPWLDLTMCNARNGNIPLQFTRVHKSINSQNPADWMCKLKSFLFILNFCIWILWSDV